MSATADASSLETVRWYTRARKFPQMIGRTADGARIWGGPYTVTQAIGGGLVLLVAAKTTSLWVRFGFFTSIGLLVCIFCAVVFGLGLIPYGARNPLSLASGALHAVAAPTYGRVAGRKVQPPRPIRVRHRILIAPTPADTTGGGDVYSVVAVDPFASTTASGSTTRSRAADVPAAHQVDEALADPVVERGDRRRPRGPLTGVQTLLAATPPLSSDASTRRPQEHVR